MAEKVLVGLPSGFADLPPGRELAVVLSMVDPTTLSGQDLVEVLAARHRQTCHDQARQLQTIRELAYSRPGPVGGPPLRRTIVDPHADTEIAFALTWTDYTANLMLSVAFTVLEKTPAIHAAMLAGRCDLDKAKVFTTELDDCEPDQARAVVARILPEIARLTTGQLRDALRKLLLTIDPAAVRKRHDKALADRCVQHQEFANGTAAIAATYLPKDKVAAAFDHVDAIARATKAAGGDERTIDQLRADVMADLLAGVDPTTPEQPDRHPAKAPSTCTSTCPPWPAWTTCPAKSPASAPSWPTSPAKPHSRWPNTPNGASMSPATTATWSPKAACATGPPPPKPRSSTPATAPAAPPAAADPHNTATTTTTSTGPSADQR